MMVGNQNRAQGELVRVQMAQHGLGIARIDDRGSAAVVQKPQVIVLKCRNGRNLNCHGGKLPYNLA
jgi:hypothetical protein